jgi:hypothetical protein
MQAAEAQRADLIGRIDLRTVDRIVPAGAMDRLALGRDPLN